MNDKENEKLADDVSALVQAVMRESYLSASEDLRAYAEKVRHFNQQKKLIRDYLTALRQFKAHVLTTARERGVDLCRTDKNDMQLLKEVFEEHASERDLDDLGYELCLPDRVPAKSVTNFDFLESEVARWEEKLNSIGDDAQLANVDLQNVLQKQQQTLQMMSNISKALYDTAMSVIRKMGG
jgi:hypothetical protein